MKNILIKCGLLFFIVGSLAACRTTYIKTHPHGMPPGQKKKITGSKSAKPYAPGQRKKH